MDAMDAKVLPHLSLYLFLAVSRAYSHSYSCSNHSFSQIQSFSTCMDMPNSGSYLYWNYNSSSMQLEIAYRYLGSISSKWIAWAINPTSTGMIGSQAIVAAHQNDKHGGAPVVYTSPITSYNTRLQKGKISFAVANLSVTVADNETIIYATLRNVSATANMTWQTGPFSDAPDAHSLSAGKMSSAKINFLAVEVQLIASNANDFWNTNGLKNMRSIHAVLNIASWGVIMPMTALVARYGRQMPAADPSWFYIHMCCQFVAYILGAVGWGTGMNLGGKTPGVQHIHRSVGIAVFSLGTTQVVASVLRPRPGNKFRPAWNWFHLSVGYAAITLGFINVLEGFRIIGSDTGKNVYASFIFFFSLTALCFECYVRFVRRHVPLHHK